MARAQRPPGKGHWPTICDTKYGPLQLETSKDVFLQISGFAARFNLVLVGFKECYVPMVDPVRLIDVYGDRINLVLLTLRDPRRNYMSMLQLTHPSARMPDAKMFNSQYLALCDLALRGMAKPIFLDKFRQDPTGEAKRASGLELIGEHEFGKYAGGGDPVGMTAKQVFRLDRRERYLGSEIDGAAEAYDRLRCSIDGAKVKSPDAT